MLSKRYTDIEHSQKAIQKLLVSAERIAEAVEHCLHRTYDPFSSMHAYNIQYHFVNLVRSIMGKKKLKGEYPAIDSAWPIDSAWQKRSIKHLDHILYFNCEVEELRHYCKQLISNYLFLDNLRILCLDTLIWEENNKEIMEIAITIKEYQNKFFLKELREKFLVTIRSEVYNKNWQNRKLSFIFNKLTSKWFIGKYYSAILNVVGKPPNMSITFSEWDEEYPEEDMFG